MLRTLIISPDQKATESLKESLVSIGVEVSRVVDQYLGGKELLRLLRAHAPEVLFLSFENVASASETVRFIEIQNPGLQIVATHRVCDAALLRETMRVGIREFVTAPFDPQALREVLSNVKGLLEKKPATYSVTNDILSFLPSKAGSGTTTLAMNIAAALARGRQETEVGLVDLDLNSGMLRFLLKLTTDYSLVEAVENAATMDENMWGQLITPKFGMDVLHAGRVNPNLRIEPAHMHHLVQFMRRNYKALVFDLSGNLERYSIEAMQESQRVFIVCTPEIPSLHLAREKMGFLKTLGLEGKVSLLLNRVTKRPIFTVTQVEDLVGAKVVCSFSNDYFAVSRATTAGQCLDPDSVIGRQCAQFAATLGDRRQPTHERRKKFLEFFNVSTPQEVSAD